MCVSLMLVLPYHYLTMVTAFITGVTCPALSSDACHHQFNVSTAHKGGDQTDCKYHKLVGGSFLVEVIDISKGGI
jgi:hypothetical protein